MRVLLLASYVLTVPCATRSFAPKAQPPVLIDLRPRDDYIRQHLASSSSMPVSELELRMFELPPPGEWPLTLLGSDEQIAQAQALIKPRGWMAEELVARPSTWNLAEVRSGPPEQLTPHMRPNSFLASIVQSVGSQLPTGAAVDVGCGSGRDAVYIAQQTRSTTYGIDNHRAALERGKALARTCGVDVRFLHSDIRKAGLAIPPEDPLVLVHGCRFLHRQLFETLPEALAPGGIVVWSTFLEGCEELAPPFRASRRLEKGEMRSLLGGAQGFDVLHDEEGELLTRGVWVPAQFYAARKRGLELDPG